MRTTLDLDGKLLREAMVVSHARNRNQLDPAHPVADATGCVNGSCWRIPQSGSTSCGREIPIRTRSSSRPSCGKTSSPRPGSYDWNC